MLNPDNNSDYTAYEHINDKKNIYRKIVTLKDRIVGMSFVNDTVSAGIVLAMIQRKQKLSLLPADILSPGFDFSTLRL